MSSVVAYELEQIVVTARRLPPLLPVPAGVMTAGEIGLIAANSARFGASMSPVGAALNILFITSMFLAQNYQEYADEEDAKNARAKALVDAMNAIYAESLDKAVNALSVGDDLNVGADDAGNTQSFGTLSGKFEVGNYAGSNTPTGINIDVRPQTVVQYQFPPEVDFEQAPIEVQLAMRLPEMVRTLPGQIILPEPYPESLPGFIPPGVINTPTNPDLIPAPDIDIPVAPPAGPVGPDTPIPDEGDSPKVPGIKPRNFFGIDRDRFKDPAVDVNPGEKPQNVPDAVRDESKRQRKDKKDKNKHAYVQMYRLVSQLFGSITEFIDFLRILEQNTYLRSFWIMDWRNGEFYKIERRTRLSDVPPWFKQQVIDKIGMDLLNDLENDRFWIDVPGLAKGVFLEQLQDMAFAFASKAERKLIDRSLSGITLFDAGNFSTWVNRNIRIMENIQKDIQDRKQ